MTFAIKANDANVLYAAGGRWASITVLGLKVALHRAKTFKSRKAAEKYLAGWPDTSDVVIVEFAA